VVLTVHHYFLEAERVKVRAGDWDIAEEYEVLPHQVSDVESVVGHSGYNKRE
jgi:hypothetical protein